MRIVVGTVGVPFIQGGAEVLTEDLTDALRARGHEVELLNVPWKWYPTHQLIESVATFRTLDLAQCVDGPIDLFLGMKFPAYLIRHPQKVLWLVHQHRPAVDLWDHEFGLSNAPRGREARELIRAADQCAALEAERVYAISETVTRRFRESVGTEVLPLRPPPRNAEKFHAAAPTQPSAEDYLFFPSRVTLLKRQDLVLRALALTEEPVRVVFTGLPDAPQTLAENRRLATQLGVAERIEWRGWVDDEELIESYARAIGVIFCPVDEDYGYVTLEAMLSAKPVLTCTDSGGVLEFVDDGETGLVRDPRPEALADAMDLLWRDRAGAARMGRQARQRLHFAREGWTPVLDELLQESTH